MLNKVYSKDASDSFDTKEGQINIDCIDRDLNTFIDIQMWDQYVSDNN